MAKPIFNQFNGGEISPLLEGRIDLQKYPYSARLMRNFIPLVEGALVRRGGSHFVASCKEEDAISFKIVADPSEAEIYINNELCDEIFCAVGEKVTYTVSMEGYQSVSGSYVVEADTVLPVVLVSRQSRSTITVKSIPEGADIFINGIPRTTAEVLRGSIAYYEAILDGYSPEKGQVQVNNDMEVTVTLGMSFEIIPNPADAIVMINGERQSKVKVNPGDVVSWSVEKSGYMAQSGSETINESMVKYIDLGSGEYEINQAVFEKSVPGRYRFYLKQSGWYDLSICSAGGGGGGSPYKHDYQGTDGSSGAAFHGKVYLIAGDYFVKVGKGGSGGQASGKNATSGMPLVYNPQSILDGVSAIKIENSSNGFIIDMNPGYGGRGTFSYSSTTEKGGTFVQYAAVQTQGKILKSDGEIRSTFSILGNGFGAGGKAAAKGGYDGNSGTNGYCKLVYLGLA